MGHVSRDHIAAPIVETFSCEEFTLGDGLLTFQYCLSKPGVCSPGLTTRHCLVIPLQSAPIRARITRNNKDTNLTLNYGDIALAPAGEEVSWQWFDQAHVVLIWIDPEGFRHFIEQDLRLILDENGLENEVVVNDLDLVDAAARMRDATTDNGLGAQILFEAMARVFLVVLVRNYGHTVKTHDDRTHLTMSHFAQIVDYIEARIGDHISPSDLAAQVGMSETAFGRRFKARLGKTPMQLVTEIRIRTATQLILQGELSLGQIAIRCGFSDQSHLSRKFKKAHGITPRAYRQRHYLD